MSTHKKKDVGESLPTHILVMDLVLKHGQANVNDVARFALCQTFLSCRYYGYIYEAQQEWIENRWKKLYL